MDEATNAWEVLRLHDTDHQLDDEKSLIILDRYSFWVD